mgnify:CR=1 FL=1
MRLPLPANNCVYNHNVIVSLRFRIYQASPSMTLPVSVVMGFDYGLGAVPIWNWSRRELSYSNGEGQYVTRTYAPTSDTWHEIEFRLVNHRFIFESDSVQLIVVDDNRTPSDIVLRVQGTYDPYNTYPFFFFYFDDVRVTIE